MIGDEHQFTSFEQYEPHDVFMHQALVQAQQAYEEREVPVGAIIVQSGRIIASAHNQREQLHDPTAHAEMIAITQAAESVGNWRLEECTLYVTLEPCAMCAGAIVLARIPNVVFGAVDPKAGAVHSLISPVGRPTAQSSLFRNGGCDGRSVW